MTRDHDTIHMQRLAGTNQRAQVARAGRSVKNHHEQIWLSGMRARSSSGIATSANNSDASSLLLIFSSKGYAI